MIVLFNNSWYKYNSSLLAFNRGKLIEELLFNNVNAVVVGRSIYEFGLDDVFFVISIGIVFSRREFDLFAVDK